tara:strand:- start:312 stop:1028 length:717 start_codon:yes stop_codon:yes gene_type:complete
MTKYRALLLSAGLGTRLRPLTLSEPKCLMKINNEVLLERWLKILDKDIESVLINKHYMYKKVEEFLSIQDNFKIKIYQTFEKTLLGTAGTLMRNAEFFNGYTGLLIHSDNYTDFDLNSLLRRHSERPKECLLTMLVFETDTPSLCGIVETDDKGIVRNFHEKVQSPPSNLANGAVYVFDNDFFTWINQNFKNVNDFSNQIIPGLMGRIFTCKTDSLFIDIGTLENFNLAQKLSLKAKY